MMRMTRRTFLQISAGAAMLHPSMRMAFAQDYPTHPVRLVIPFPPGGAFDAVGRPWAERMGSLVGTVVVENMGGGGGSIGAAAVARAKPDGYTLLLGGTLPHVNESLLKKHPLYDPAKDLDPIAAVAANVLCIAVHPSVPARNLEDLIAYARANPGKLSFGHAGLGSIQHLAGELFKSLAGVPDIVQVPYRGTGPVVTDLVGGQIPMAVPGVTHQVLDFHRAGRLRILAMTSAERLLAAPDLPTAAEQGFPRLVVRGSIGMLAPAGTPPAVTERIALATHGIVSDAGWRRMLVDSGIEPIVDSGPEQFRRSLAADVAQWSPVVKALAVTID